MLLSELSAAIGTELFLAGASQTFSALCVYYSGVSIFGRKLNFFRASAPLRQILQAPAREHQPGSTSRVVLHTNDIDSIITDRSFELLYWGRFRITNDSNDKGRYKTPSLRNLGFTAPYMHDGRFVDLDQVFAHYFQDHRQSPLADSVLIQRDYSVLNAKEKKALKAFLYTLNDSAFVGLKP